MHYTGALLVLLVLRRRFTGRSVVVLPSALSSTGTTPQMEEPKPKVPPRSSLLKKPPIENGAATPPVNSRPNVPSKPKILSPKPPSEKPPATSAAKVSTHTSASKVERTASKPTLVTQTSLKTSNVKVCNKLKISASDLNKLRFRTDLFEDKNADNKSSLQIYDVREDPEQIAKMGEISELLVAGGYFRARIKGLHNFDKIIGGICWAIQMCNVDLDIDIFYQETLSIGQKIGLTEKIVRVLQKMKCPFKLEPHQIQGLDCIHIFPVIQWLIKESLLTRHQTSDYIRAYAAWQFNRHFNHKDSSSSSVIFSDTDMANQLIDPIKAQLRRRFVHPTREKLQGEAVRTRTTMLEYGVLGTGSSQRLVTQSGSDPKSPIKTKQSQVSSSQQKPRSESDSQMVENLLSSMTEMDENEETNFAKLSSSLVDSIFSEQSDEKYNVFERKNATALITEAKLKNEISHRQNELSKLSQTNTEEKLQTIKEKLDMINDKLKETEEMEKNESPEIKAEKLQLTELLSALRKQKSEFKQFCRDEKQRLEAQIEQLNNKKADNTEFNDKVKVIDQDAQVHQERFDSIKKELADVNKRYVVLQRKFDDVPTRTELGQYQKRFLELYNQLSNKHNETKKFYTLYNILSEERSYLEKEFNLINSILDNFKTAYVSSAMVKEEFVAKFEQIVESIIQNKTKVEQRLVVEKTKRDQLNTEYIDLVEQQRLYFKAVKEFKEECKINEQLLARLESSSS